MSDEMTSSAVAALSKFRDQMQAHALGLTPNNAKRAEFLDLVSAIDYVLAKVKLSDAGQGV